MNQTYQPQSISQEISIQDVGEETLIYDERRHLAFCLNEMSSAVWKRCDGARNAEQIAAALCIELALPVTEEIVLLALQQLAEDGLLESSADAYAEVSPATLRQVSRREMMTSVAYGAAILVPAIAMITAPKAAQAYNGCTDCTSAAAAKRGRGPSAGPSF